MGIFWSIILFLFILILFLVFLALIVRKSYVIERDIVIDQHRALVFDYIKKLKNQEYYSIWVMRDPDNQITYHGVDGTAGFISKWEGKKAGKGEQEIKSLIADSTIHIELRFEKPFKNIGQSYLIVTDAGENQTHLKWKLTGRNEFPMSLFNLIIGGVLGNDMGKSLLNLKDILENKR